MGRRDSLIIRIIIYLYYRDAFSVEKEKKMLIPVLTHMAHYSFFSVSPIIYFIRRCIYTEQELDAILFTISLV